MIDKINVRAYCCIVKDKKVLVLHEEYVGQHLMKFPGGGLEFGEGLIDCLHREIDEELNLKLTNIQHLYTQENFQTSRFRDNEQLLTIYYTADIVDENELLIRDMMIEKIEWLDLNTDINPMPLPIDKIAFDKLKEKYIF